MRPSLPSFEFAYPEADLIYGERSAARLGQLVESLDARRALVLSGPNVHANDVVVGSIRDGLGDRLAGWFAGLEPFMPEGSIRAGIAAADAVHADVLVAVGGGSTLDGSKAVQAMYGQATDLVDYLERYRVRRNADDVVVPELPATTARLIAVPTTLSGAEWNGATSVLRGGERVRLRSRLLAPRLVVYDPMIVATTPPNLLRATAMNALDHAVEIYYGRTHDPIKDAFALAALRELSSHAIAALGPRLDVEELGHVMLGSALSAGWMNSLLIIQRAGHGINHALGHVLATKYGMSQGDAHAIVMPHGMEFVRDAARPRLADIGQSLGGSASADSAIERIRAIRDALGLPSRLRERLSEPSVLPHIAAEAIMDFSVLNTPRTVTLNDLEMLLERAW